MAYFMRFLAEDDQPLNLEEVMSGLRSADPGFRLDEDGIVAKGQELLAELDVSGLAATRKLVTASQENTRPPTRTS